MEIVVTLGKEIHGKVNRLHEMEHLVSEINKARKDFILEFERIPPRVSFRKEESGNGLIYGFDIEGWAKVVHIIDEYTFNLETRTDMSKRLLFYLKRYMRKWFVSCPDITIERNLKEIPIMIEVGGGLIDVVESKEFQQKFVTISREIGVDTNTYSIWESDYVAHDEMVIYIYGKDYFLNSISFRTAKDHVFEHVLTCCIQPILRENKELLKKTPDLPES